MQGKTCEDTETAVANDVMNDDWKTRGGSIWNHGQERSTSRVKCRATTCQLVQLVKFMEKHKELAVSHTQPFLGSDQLWDQLAAHINQFGPPKTPKQCKTTWRDLRKRAFAMVRARSKDKNKAMGRNLYGMAPKIISLIAAAGGLPKATVIGNINLKHLSHDELRCRYLCLEHFDKKYVQNVFGQRKRISKLAIPHQYKITARGLVPAPEKSATQQASPVVPVSDLLVEKPDVVKVVRTSSGDQLVIRVTDKLDSKTNVFNRFSVSDGHFENNIIVKEEREDPLRDHEESSENMETDRERPEYSQTEEFIPAAEAIIGNQDDPSEGKDKVLKELNETLRRFVSEYAERTHLLRERIELDRARLQFDMDVFNSKAKNRENNKDNES